MLDIGLAVLILTTLLNWLVQNAFGAQLPYYQIAFFAVLVYFVLGCTAVVVEARVARSRATTTRIVAGLALITILLVFIAVTPAVLLSQWSATEVPIALVALAVGLTLILPGWRKADQTVRQMAGEYTSHRGGMVWAGPQLTFRARRYHLILVAGMLGAFILFLSSIITSNFVYAAGGFLYLVIMVFVAGTVKTRRLALVRSEKGSLSIASPRTENLGEPES